MSFRVATVIWFPLVSIVFGLWDLGSVVFCENSDNENKQQRRRFVVFILFDALEFETRNILERDIIIQVALFDESKFKHKSVIFQNSFFS